MVVAIAAVLALLAGAAVGRNLLSSATPTTPRADIVHFKDEVAKYSIDYPASWTRLPQPEGDTGVALLVAGDASTSLLVRVSDVGLTTVTRKTLPIVRKLTDDLIGADPRAKQLVDPAPVELGGLPGWRYRYTYQSDTAGGAHDHYFLFKAGRMIQLVFQAQPATRLPAVAGTFDR
ncbi:MAG: hypothetical protein Q8K63_09115, partial [Acidimicrobiales bacterium]|nr:hypothetical protein [Acidimicrobiales bacterium]